MNKKATKLVNFDEKTESLEENNSIDVLNEPSESNKE
jgi:hypothetical protein